MNKVLDIRKKINLPKGVKRDEPLAPYTTFKVGGPSDYFYSPHTVGELKEILMWARKESLPYFLLGRGANVLVSDEGYRGLVVEMKHLSRIEFKGELALCESGCDLSEFIEVCAEKELNGLAELYGMPSSLGGALWMNARCYGIEISDHLLYVDYLDEDLNLRRYTCRREDWKYKVSPFQSGKKIILQGAFRLQKGNKEKILSIMRDKYNDREQKGHFKAPCAGSIFKNDRSIGEPSGKIIDSLGLRGLSIGDAAVSDWHANIIINRGEAKAKDIRSLIEKIAYTVKQELGFDLEPEVLYVGQW